MEIHFYAKSHIGKVRTTNEDYFHNEKISEDEYLFIVADGMGGHKAGDVASRMASLNFAQHYKQSRKKNDSIINAMEIAIRKANSSILKKASSDQSKKGMGTTFSAMVVAGMKVNIVHIGDSRIYLVRKNRIKRLTKDHSFVEKMIEDGRITVDEAREHPQKNVLYMSLGAREGFSPEIIEDFQVEEGDLFLMCTDGLSNMVADNFIKDYSLSYYPEDSVEALIKLANSNGGTDNITLQVIRIGSLEVMEETKPLRLFKPKKTTITIISILGVVAIFIALWLVFVSITHPNTEMLQNQPSIESVIPRLGKGTLSLQEISTRELSSFELAPEDYKFISGNRLCLSKDQTVFFYDITDSSILQINLQPDEEMVPSSLKDIYLLKRIKSQVPEYRLFKAGDKKPTLIIQSKGASTVRKSSTPSIKGMEISGRVRPILLADDFFIFNDRRRYYVVMDWLNAGEVFPPSEISYSMMTRLSFKKLDGTFRMVYHNPEEKVIKVFNIGRFERAYQIQNLSLDPPLAIESCKNNCILYYYSDMAVRIVDGQREEMPYQFNSQQVNIVKVLVNLSEEPALLIDQTDRLFLVKSKND